MQVRCVRPFGRHAVGDLAEVPDGARMDPAYWEPAAAPPPADPEPAKAAAAPSASLFAPKEGM